MFVYILTTKVRQRFKIDFRLVSSSSQNVVYVLYCREYIPLMIFSGIARNYFEGLPWLNYGRVCEIFETTATGLVAVQPFKVISKH